MSIQQVGIVGAGMMGAEIALCFAKAEYQTVLSDASLELAERGKNRLFAVLDKQIAKGKLDAGEKEPILERIVPCGQYSEMAHCDFIVEAVPEDVDIKAAVYRQLDAICDQNTIFASNTSTISITKLAAFVSPERAKRFVGTHFNSPASIMKLVEVIPGMLTESETVNTTLSLLESIEKVSVQVKDVTGFGLNRLLHVFITEACRLLEEGVCSVEDVDKICKFGLGHPMGIFALMDQTGLDLNLKVQQLMFEAYGERYRPSAQLQRRVDSGYLGRKSGRGFYEYSVKEKG